MKHSEEVLREITVVRFFCKRCGKELWDLVDWENSYMRYFTLEQMKTQLICSDCMLAEIREDRDENIDEDRDS